jgi:hypothetical protein
MSDFGSSPNKVKDRSSNRLGPTLDRRVALVQIKVDLKLMELDWWSVSFMLIKLQVRTLP